MGQVRYILALFIVFATGLGFVLAQKGKKSSSDEESQSQAQALEMLRKECRAALKPYRYDASKTTIFSYKQFDYIKEVEISLTNDNEYLFSVNSGGIVYDKIDIQIYDRPEGSRGRILLYEKKGVGGSNFTFKSSELLNKLKEVKKSKGVDQALIDKMYLKSVFFNFIIPAVDKEVETDKKGEEIVIIKKGAIIIAVGYENI